MIFPRHSLLWRATVMAWTITLGALVLYAVALFPQQRRDYLDNLESKARGITVSLRDLTASALVNEDYSAVVDHCTEMLRGDPSLEFIVLTRLDGFSLIHDRQGWRTEQLGGAWIGQGRTPMQHLDAQAPFAHETFRYSTTVDYSGIEWGRAHIGLSLDSYRASVRRLALRASAVGIGALLLAFAASWYYARVLLQPVVELQDVVRRIAAGELTARASTRRPDELGSLAASVNLMTEAILHRDRTLQEANSQLEARVEARTRELREQKEAAELTSRELRETQLRLVESSRMAGMAEVATGVLHNVGNVLNSVNVSANILREQICANPHLDLLGKTGALLREQAGQLPRFLTEDPRGRMVPPLLVEIADGIGRWRSDVTREFTLLGENIGHIKQIVSVQQTNAKAAGVHQNFDPLDVFSDALRLASPSIGRHGVSVATHATPTRKNIITDRHLAVQIMVNLVRNAIQAVKVRPVGRRHVALRLDQTHDRVIFSVEDNGVGIPPENRQKLFQHGFTTRKDGHGFGLHSGALAAATLGGSLNVHSEGADRGATFTLELPLTQ